MTSWRKWCRLCANPSGGAPLFSNSGNELKLSEKIRKYLSISVSEEDKVSCSLCPKCIELLVTFDNFVNRCAQVQAMFNVLSELVDDGGGDERVSEIRKDFLSYDSEFYKQRSINDTSSPTNGRKKISEEGKENTPSVFRKENGSSRKQFSSVRRKGCEVKNRQVSDFSNYCRKSGRLKAAAELKQAFGEENEILTDSLDSDFNEESFEHLLDSDDSLQQDLRISTSALKMKVDSKSTNLTFPTSNNKHADMLEQLRSDGPDRTCLQGRALDTTEKRHQISKPGDSLSTNELNCGLLSGDINGSCVNSLSESDINDFICNENANLEDVGSSEREALSTSKDCRVNIILKNLDKAKSFECRRPVNEQDHDMYELNEMFVDASNDEESNRENDWNLHKNSENNDVKKKTPKTKEQVCLRCDQCDKTFHRKALLTAHLSSHVPKDQQPYVCCKCARRFHCEALLRNHERVHLPSEEKLLYPCNVCSKKFSSRSAVTAHLKAIHFGERPFICHLCGNSFSSKGILQEHLTIHSDEEPWHCTKCSKRFKTKYRLKIHMDTHRETPYSCPHCEIQLSTRRTLRMHLVVHRDTKAFQCATCGKAFRRAKDLKNHHNLHTGKRPYSCPFCSRTFANGSNCRSHKRRMHPEELRLYEAALAGSGENSNVDLINNSATLETDPGTTLMEHQELDDEGNQSMKEDSQDSLLTEMALDLQQPTMLSGKPGLTPVDDDPVATAADLTLTPLVTLSSALPKLEPDDSRLVMNLTTQMHDAHDSMEAMSPLNLNIMSPMNLNMTSPLNLNVSSPLNLNISNVLHSPTGRNQQQSSVQSQHHHNASRFQQTNHQSQQHHQHLSLQPTQQQTHQQIPQHNQHLAPQVQMHQHQMHHQQVQRSSLQISNLHTLNSPSLVHALPSQTQLPAHLNNSLHHSQQLQTFIPLNQQGTVYSNQDTVSSAALVAAAAVAHSMSTSTSTTLPSFSGNPYVQHSMAYGRGTSM